jgi:hypothetical protein
MNWLRFTFMMVRTSESRAELTDRRQYCRMPGLASGACTRLSQRGATTHCARTPHFATIRSPNSS